jgi:hypothetical protein
VLYHSIGAIAGIIPRKNAKTKFNGYRDLVVNRLKRVIGSNLEKILKIFRVFM